MFPTCPPLPASVPTDAIILAIPILKSFAVNLLYMFGTTAFSSGMSWSKLDGNVITIGKHSKESCTQKIYIAWQ